MSISKADKSLTEKIMPLGSAEMILDLLADADQTESANAERSLVAKHHEWIRGVDNRIKKHGDRLADVEKKTEAATRRLSKIDPHEVERALDSFAERVRFLSERLALLITKTTAATEIPWLVSRMRTDSKGRPFPDEQVRSMTNLARAAVIRAIDYPDQWWHMHGNRPMSSLLTELLNSYEKDIWAEFAPADDRGSSDGEA
jgi:hypothetical protein